MTSRADAPGFPAAEAGESRVLVAERDSLRALLEAAGGEGELGGLLARALGDAARSLEADHGAIALLTDDDRALRLAAVHGARAGPAGRSLPLDRGLVGEALRSGAPLRLERLDEADAVLSAPRGHAAAVVPIHGDGRLLGVLALARPPLPTDPDASGFSDAELALLERLARYVSTAVLSVRRLERERERAERLALITHVGRLVTADLQLGDLLQRAADAIHEILGYENVAIAVVAPDDPDVLWLRSFGGAYKRSIGGEHRIPFAEGLMGAAARTRQVVCVSDAAADPRYLPTPGTRGQHAELVLPLLLAGDVLGVLNVERRLPFGRDDVEHLQIVADQLAVAIENARLLDAARQAAVLEERQRLARELHDSVTQHLFTATLVAQSLGAAYARDAAEGTRRAGMLVQVTRAALDEMRALLTELRPGTPGASAEPPMPDPGLSQLRAEGLVAALRAHVAVSFVDGPPVELDVADYAAQPAAREEALYRVAREALHNVVKHAHASRAHVRLAVDRAGVHLTVRDDGVGFASPAAAGPRTRASLGLASMHERVAELGGSVRVQSAPRRGTRVDVALPPTPDGPP
jgi:signal transduction histidine kinase